MFYFLLEKIKISGIWLYNSGYLITQQEQTVKNRLSHGSKKLARKKTRFGKISCDYDILTVEDK